MYHQIELEQRELSGLDLVKRIDSLNMEINKMKIDKQILEEKLFNVLGHIKEGSKTYDVGYRKVTLKADMIYSLDKKSYENGDLFLPSEFDPIVKKTTYEVNKRLFKKYEQTAPLSVRKILNELVTIKEAKKNVTVIL